MAVPCTVSLAFIVQRPLGGFGVVRESSVGWQEEGIGHFVRHLFGFAFHVTTAGALMETLYFYRIYGAIHTTLSEVREAGTKCRALERNPGYREWQAPGGFWS